MTVITRILAAGSLGVALLVGGAASASQVGIAGPSITQTYPGEGFAQYRYGRRYGGRGYGYRRGGGAGVAAGVIGGLAAGALIGGALAAQPGPGYGPGPDYGPGPGVAAYGPGPGQPVGNVYGRDPNFVNYCARRYRSYDPASGTYLAQDGYRYPCQ